MSGQHQVFTLFVITSIVLLWSPTTGNKQPEVLYINNNTDHLSGSIINTDAKSTNNENISTTGVVQSTKISIESIITANMKSESIIHITQQMTVEITPSVMSNDTLPLVITPSVTTNETLPPERTTGKENEYLPSILQGSGLQLSSTTEKNITENMKRETISGKDILGGSVKTQITSSETPMIESGVSSIHEIQQTTPVTIRRTGKENDCLPSIIQDENICTTPQCYTVASRMLSLVNVKVDACEDFYSYACGGIWNNSRLTEEDPAIDVWDRIGRAVKNISSQSPTSHQKLKNFYEGCVNYKVLVSPEDRRTQGHKVLESISTFALLNEPNPATELTELLIRLFKIGSAPLFNIHLDVDATNSSKFQIVLTLPDRSSSHFRTPNEETQHCRLKANEKIPMDISTIHETYQHCIRNFSEFIKTTEKALDFFGVFKKMTVNDTDGKLMQNVLMETETVMCLIKELPGPDKVLEQAQSKSYKIVSLDELERELSQISWNYLLSSVLDIDGLEDTTNVQVYFIDDLKDLLNKLQQSTDRNVHNALLAIFAHDFYEDIMRSDHTSDRERYCLEVASSLIPSVTSNLYLGTFPPETIKDIDSQVVTIYQQLEKSMEDKLSNVYWMDNQTLSEAKKKLEFMSIQQPKMFSDSYLDISLEKCPLDKKQYLEDSVCLLEQFQTQTFSRYKMDPHSFEALWSHFLTPFSTETTFIYGLNFYLVPYGAISSVYDQKMPKHVVMARLGNLLAHGIGHNFDVTGVKFASSGKIGEMLSEESSPAFKENVFFSESQFGNARTYKEDGHHYQYTLVPSLSQNERLSDITAANLSLSTIPDDSNDTTRLPWVPFTPKQVYFLALAQTFCSKKKLAEMIPSLYEGVSTPPDRVFNIASNSEQFSDAFNCKSGSTLNSQIKVRPFPFFEINPYDMSV